jgi:hypothetical protein
VKKLTSWIKPIQEHCHQTKIKKGLHDSGLRLDAFFANRLRPAYAIERSASHRFGMTAPPVYPGGFSMTFRRIAVFCRSHASHPFYPSSTRISCIRGND